MKKLLLSVIAMYMFWPIITLAQNSAQPPNAIYTTIKLYEILDSLKGKTKDSVTLKKDFVGFMKYYIGNDVNSDTYFSRIEKYPDLLNMQDPIVASLKIDIIDEALQSLISSEDNNSNLELLENLINEIKDKQKEIDGLKSKISTIKALNVDYDTLIAHKKELTNSEVKTIISAKCDECIKPISDVKKMVEERIGSLEKSVNTAESADSIFLAAKLDSLKELAPLKSSYKELNSKELFTLVNMFGANLLSDDWDKHIKVGNDSIIKELEGNQTTADEYLDNKLRELYNKLNSMPGIKSKIIQESGLAKEIIENGLKDTRIFLNGLYGSSTNYTSSLTSIKAAINYTTSAQGYALSMPSQTEMIDALAIFMADRVKQETVIWFFEQLKKNMTLYKDIQVLFPASMKLLLSNEIYETPDLGKAWRYAIAEDFIKMPENILNTTYAKTYFSRLPNSGKELSGYMHTGVSIATCLQNKYTMSETLDYLYLKSKDTSSNIGGKDYITLLYAVKQELFLLDSNKRQWLTPSVLLDMDDDMFITILSLIDLKYDNVFTKLSLPDKGSKFQFNKDKILKLKTWLAKILLNIKKLEAIYTELEKRPSNDNTHLSTFNYNVWTYTSNIIEILADLGIKDTSSEAEKGLHKLQEILDIYRDIDRKNYASAIDKSFNIIQYFHDEQLKELGAINSKFNKINADSLLKEAKRKKNSNDSSKKVELEKKIDSVDSDINVDIDKSIAQGVIVYSNKGDNSNLIELYDTSIYKLRFVRMKSIVTKVGLFLTDVSDAKSSKDLSNVVQKYALPPASYKVKKASLHSWFFNAYVGPYIGYEFLTRSVTINTTSNTTTASNYQNGLVYGLSAPIGITYARPPRKRTSSDKFVGSFTKKREARYLGASSLSITFSILDIGAVVSYRLTNTQDVLPQEFKWEQFISPGLHIAKSIPHTPLVVAISGVYTPLVRSINTADRQYSAFRLQAGVFFDIPLFTIYAKNRYANLDKYSY